MKKTFTVVCTMSLLLLTACANRPDATVKAEHDTPAAAVIREIETAVSPVPVVTSIMVDTDPLPTATPEPTATPIPSEIPALATQEPTAAPVITPAPAAPVVNVPAPTMAPAPTATPHAHEWNTITEIVHHDAVTEQVKVVDQAATEGHFEGGSYNVLVCRCGAEFTSGDAWELHYMANGEGHGGTTASVRSNQVWIEGTPEISHMETRVIQDAWDEQVIAGYVCGVCGATK